MGELGDATQLGETEVQNLDQAARAIEEHDVVRLDVAVDNSLGVRSFEPFSDLGRDGPRLFVAHGTLLESFAQSLTVEESHPDEGSALTLVYLVNGADVGMIDGGRSFGLSNEPLPNTLVAQ